MTKSLILAILLVAGLSSGSFAANETPNEVVESAVALFAAGLDGRRDELAADRAALYELIDEILLPRFDRKYAAQVVLARHWRDASESQRERFIEAFYQALLRRYADGLLQFESDKVKVLPYRGDASKSRTRVRSTVQLENGSKVAVDYDLVKRESGWLLFNVTIEGISYVRNFRAEIDSEIRSSSLDAAIRRLEREAGISCDE